ncbi:hypothetical protein [Pirellula sp. SH-Sr6A]|uniref:hypothetical protein n=1 Tax=Pirellula sp. SH-Sr6A TaxID=1632865 RepID=UPI0011BAD5FE|nr:hypothetical protein [Pirellula sp. SH-Sr6A]
MKFYRRKRQEDFDARKRNRHSADQIVKKLLEADDGRGERARNSLSMRKNRCFATRLNTGLIE